RRFKKAPPPGGYPPSGDGTGSGGRSGRQQPAPDGPAPERRDELLERLQHEEDGLEVPHLVVLVDDGVDAEGPLLGAVERVADLLRGRERAGGEDADLVGGADEPELDGEPGEALGADAVLPRGGEGGLAEELGEVGEVRLRQHRHVAEDVVEEVGRGGVVELVLAADVVGRGEEALREEGEEVALVEEAGDAGDLPAGLAVEGAGEGGQGGDPVRRQAELVDAGEVGGAGAAGEQLHLALEEEPPALVVLLGVVRVRDLVADGRGAVELLRDAPGVDLGYACLLVGRAGLPAIAGQAFSGGEVRIGHGNSEGAKGERDARSYERAPVRPTPERQRGGRTSIVRRPFRIAPTA